MLKLKANPTFKATIEIAGAGGQKVPVEFEFKHRRRSDLKEFVAAAADMSDWEILSQIAVGWSMEEPMTEESVIDLGEEFMDAPRQIFHAYISELTRARLGN